MSTSLSSTPDERSRLEAVSTGLYNFGNGHRWSIAMPGIALISGCCCFVGIAVTAAVLCGSMQRLLGLHQMSRASPDQPVGDAALFRQMKIITMIEAAMGVVFVVCMMGGASSLLPTALQPWMYPVLATAWAATLGLGLVVSNMLGNAVASQHTMDVEHSQVPALLALAGPAVLAVNLCVRALPMFDDVQLLHVVAVLTLLAAGLIWLLAAVLTGMHLTNVATSMGMRNLLQSQRANPAVSPQMERPIPRSTPEERAAARKILDDDSPIPLD